MKMTDLDESINLTETPMGGLSGLGHKLGSMMPGEFGKKQAGKLDTGKQANKLKDQFVHYVGQTGIALDPQSLEDFLSHRGLPTTKAMSTIPAGTTELEDEQIDAAILAAIQDSRTAPRSQGAQSNSSQQTTPASNNQTVAGIQQSVAQLTRSQKKQLLTYILSTI